MSPKPSRRDRKARPARNRPAPRTQAAARSPRPTEDMAQALDATEPIAAPAATGELRVIRRQAAATRPRSAAITRDYGHVRGELLRIGVLAGGIFVAIGVLTFLWD